MLWFKLVSHVRGHPTAQMAVLEQRSLSGLYNVTLDLVMSFYAVWLKPDLSAYYYSPKLLTPKTLHMHI